MGESKRDRDRKELPPTVRKIPSAYPTNEDLNRIRLTRRKLFKWGMGVGAGTIATALPVTEAILRNENYWPDRYSYFVAGNGTITPNLDNPIYTDDTTKDLLSHFHHPISLENKTVLFVGGSSIRGFGIEKTIKTENEERDLLSGAPSTVAWSYLEDLVAEDRLADVSFLNLSYDGCGAMEGGRIYEELANLGLPIEIVFAHFGHNEGLGHVYTKQRAYADHPAFFFARKNSRVLDAISYWLNDEEGSESKHSRNRYPKKKEAEKTILKNISEIQNSISHRAKHAGTKVVWCIPDSNQYAVPEIELGYESKAKRPDFNELRLKAMSHYMQKEVNASMDCLKECWEKYHDPNSLYWIAQILREIGQREESENLFNQVRDLRWANGGPMGQPLSSYPNLSPYSNPVAFSSLTDAIEKHASINGEQVINIGDICNEIEMKHPTKIDILHPGPETVDRWGYKIAEVVENALHLDTPSIPPYKDSGKYSGVWDDVWGACLSGTNFNLRIGNTENAKFYVKKIPDEDFREFFMILIKTLEAKFRGARRSIEDMLDGNSHIDEKLRNLMFSNSHLTNVIDIIPEYWGKLTAPHTESYPWPLPFSHGPVEISSPSRSKIYVDGTQLGESRWKGRLSVGRHKVVVTSSLGDYSLNYIFVEPWEEKYAIDISEFLNISRNSQLSIKDDRIICDDGIEMMPFQFSDGSIQLVDVRPWRAIDMKNPGTKDSNKPYYVPVNFGTAEHHLKKYGKSPLEYENIFPNNTSPSSRKIDMTAENFSILGYLDGAIQAHTGELVNGYPLLSDHIKDLMGGVSSEFLLMDRQPVILEYRERGPTRTESSPPPIIRTSKIDRNKSRPLSGIRGTIEIEPRPR